MDLHAGAVVLELQRGATAVGAQHLVDSRSPISASIGSSGTNGARRHAGQRAPPRPPRRQRRHRGEVAEEQRGPADGRQVGGGGARRCASSTRPSETPVRSSPPMIRSRNSRSSSPARAASSARRACRASARAAARRRGDRRERGAHVAKGERRTTDRRDAARQAAHAEHTGIRRRERMAGEERHRRRKLARVEGLEEVGHEPALLEAPRRGLEPPAERGRSRRRASRPHSKGRGAHALSQPSLVVKFTEAGRGSTGLPEGSSRRICEPPGPVTMSLRK